ncbi:MAG: hypothetical protein WCP77_03525 [Roseococcus sp.]
MDFINPVNGGPAIDYLRRELGYGSTRYSRTYFRFWQSEQMTGHTALFVRVKGQAAWARGWVPKPTVSNYASALLGGGEVPGEWQDDLTMIDDPTCISLEYDVGDLDTLRLMEHWDKYKSNFTQYAFTVNGSGRCNCVWAAITNLRNFASVFGKKNITSGLQRVDGPGQGPLMTKIAAGELLLY